MMNFLTAKWQNLIMANYEIAPAILERYLPAGTEFDFHEGRTYVSLVGFLFAGTRIFGFPIPGLGTFEEINLRFYVIRRDGDERKRGVVFINETVPYKPVAWLANKLYKEHYIAIPTRHSWKITDTGKEIAYSWQTPGTNDWSHIKVQAGPNLRPMQPGSIEEFIFEHYYGYTRLSDSASEEYKVEHPRWLTNPIIDCSIRCDFGAMYGEDFGFLSGQQPSSVMLAEGSAIAVKWKRSGFDRDETDDLFENNFVMSASLAIELIQSYFTEQLAIFGLTHEYNDPSGYWGIIYSYKGILISINCERGYLENKITIEGEDFSLLEFESMMMNVKLGSEKNIRFLLDVIRRFAEKRI